MKNCYIILLFCFSFTLPLSTHAQRNKLNFFSNLGQGQVVSGVSGNWPHAIDEQGNYIVAVNYTDPIRLGDSLLNKPCRNYKTTLVFVDSAGSIQWIKEIAGQASVRNVEVVRSFDNAFIISGVSSGPIQLGTIRLNHPMSRRRNGCRVRDTTSFVFVAKIDQNGNYRWAHKIGNEMSAYNTVLEKPFFAGPGGIVGIISHEGFSVDLARQSKQFRLDDDSIVYAVDLARVTFNHNGELLSFVPYDGYVAAEIESSAGVSYDSSTLVLAGLAKNQTLSLGGVVYPLEGTTDIVLGKTDVNGFVSKQVWVHGPKAEVVTNVVYTKGGKIVMAGSVVDATSPPNLFVRNKVYNVPNQGSVDNGLGPVPIYPWVMGFDEDLNPTWFISDTLFRNQVSVIGSPKSNFFIALCLRQATNVSPEYMLLKVFDARTGKPVTANAIVVPAAANTTFDPVGRINFIIDQLADSLEFPILDNYRVRVPGNNSVLLGTTICDLTQAEISTRTGSSGICTGDSAVFTCEVSSEGPIIYRWQRNGLDIPGADQPRYVTRLSGKYRCIVQNRLGCIDTSAADSVFLINELPPNGTLAAKGALSFCEGDSVNLAARSPQLGVTYRWMRNGLFIDGADSILAAKKSGVYKAVVTSAAGCSFLTDSIIVKVTNLPAAYIDTSAGTIKCVNQPVVLFTTRRPGYSFQWYRDNNLVPNQTDASLVTAQPGSYRVQITNPQGCGVMSPAMPIRILPNSGLLLESSANTLKCPNDEVLLFTRFTKAGTQLEWRHDGQVITNFRNDSLRTNLPGRYTVHVVGNTTGLCAVQSNDITVYNHPVVNINITSGPGINSFCEGDSLPLIASDINGYTYTWLKDGNPQGVTSSRLWAKSTGNYQVQALSPNGCPVSSNIFTPTATPVPDNQVTITGSLSLCAGDSVILEANETGASYQWLRSGLPLSNSRRIIIDSSGNYQLILRNGANCESRSQTYQVSVAPAINAGITMIGSALFANPSGASYTWLFQGQPVPGGNSQSLLAQISGEYRVVVTQGNCSDTSAVQLVIGGVSSATAAGFRISPIPATHTLNVTLPSGMSTTVNAQLINLLGQTVWQGALPAAQNSIHISALPAGQYLLQLQTADRVYLQRVVRE